jgi:hypothetical protein
MSSGKTKTPFDRFIEVLENAKYGEEAGHGKGYAINTRGDRPVLASVVFTTRAEPNDIPTLLLIDQKAANDAYKLGTGDLKYAKKPNKQQAYKALLSDNAGQPIRLEFSKANLLQNGAVNPSDIDDFSALPINLDVLPFKCWHFDDNVKRVFPRTWSEVDDAIKNTDWVNDAKEPL